MTRTTTNNLRAQRPSTSWDEEPTDRVYLPASYTPPTPAIPAAASDKEIMDPREAAAFLKLPDRVLTACTESGEIPHRRVGGYCRYSRTALIKWFDFSYATSEDKP